MVPGQVVNLVSRETPTGLPVSMGPGRLIEKVGTIPDFWLVEYLTGNQKGSRKRVFVHPEDQEPVSGVPGVQAPWWEVLKLMALQAETNNPRG
jgi:hypothetical protein